MLFSELVNETITLTNRPDFINEIRLHVLKACHKLHTMDFWTRDRRVDVYTFDTSAYIQTLSVRGVFPGWRAFSFIRIWDASGRDWQTQLLTGTGRYPLIEIVDPQQLFDEYYTDKLNVAYMAGDSLSFRFAIPVQQILVGWYKLPILVADDAQFNSWIAEDYPWAIIDHAAASVFKMIGYDDQSRKMDVNLAEHLQILRTNCTTPVGY